MCNWGDGLGFVFTSSSLFQQTIVSVIESRGWRWHGKRTNNANIIIMDGWILDAARGDYENNYIEPVRRVWGEGVWACKMYGRVEWYSLDDDFVFPLSLCHTGVDLHYTKQPTIHPHPSSSLKVRFIFIEYHPHIWIMLKWICSGFPLRILFTISLHRNSTNIKFSKLNPITTPFHLLVLRIMQLVHRFARTFLIRFTNYQLIPQFRVSFPCIGNYQAEHMWTASMTLRTIPKRIQKH